MAGGTKAFGLYNKRVDDEEDNSDQKCSAEELRQLKESEKKSTNSYDHTKMRPEVIQLANKMNQATNSNEAKKSKSVASYNPTDSPSILDTVDYRSEHKQCIMDGCNKLADRLGLCDKHFRDINLSDSELAFIKKYAKDLIDSKRQLRMAQLGESDVLDLHFLVECEFLSHLDFIDGNGFSVASGYAPAREGEDKKSYALELAGMMNCNCMSAFIQKMGERGFFMTDEDKKKYGNLQANGSIPRGWDYSKGLVMHRETCFRAGVTPDLGMSEEQKQKVAVWRKEAKKRKMLAKDPSASVSPTKLVKPKMSGGGTCQVPGCGKTKEDDSYVKRGKCSLHRTPFSHPPCEHPGCETWKNLTKGKCTVHREKRICVAPGCTSQGKFAGQLCRKHRNN